MKSGTILLLLMIVAVIGVIAADRYFVAEFEKEFRELEKQRIIISNKLATAKIVHENLNHVRDLVFKNIDFPGQNDSITHETHFFEFLTTCINDLKLNLISVKPVKPAVSDRVTTFAYDIELEGDFFKFGELCSKFENSRRIVSIETFKVDLRDARAYADSRDKRRGAASNGNKDIRVEMRVNTYRVKKEPEPVEPLVKGKTRR